MKTPNLAVLARGLGGSSPTNALRMRYMRDEKRVKVVGGYGRLLSLMLKN